MEGSTEGNTMASGRIYSRHWKRGPRKRMMRLLGRRRNDDEVLDSDATSPPYLTRQFLFESYFPTLAFEYSSCCNSAGPGS